jgi:hypothetical protein
MYKPYLLPVVKAEPDIKIPEPRISKVIIFLVKFFARLYLFIFFGVARVVLRGERHFYAAFKRALSGKSRCILAFRHPNGGEPQLLSWFIIYRLKTLAARAGFRFDRKPHAVFVYGYEVVRWGGWVARLVMPRLGAMPVHHAKVDSQGMARIYKAIVNGPYPLAIAPEGQVSYTSESIPRMEQGTIRIGFHAAARLARVKGDGGPALEILPISIHFRYGVWGKFTLELLLKKIEKNTGQNSQEKSFTRRLKDCLEHILTVNEKRYAVSPGPEAEIGDRIDQIIEAAMNSAAHILRVKEDETELFTRLARLSQICWDRLCLPGYESLDTLSRVERGSADLQAGEAWYACRHLELVGFSWYFRVPLPAEDAPLHVKIEYAQNLWDFASRSMGGGYPNRVNHFPRRVIIQAAPPINLSERLPAYHRDKKASINQAMEDLKEAYIKCIEAVNDSD